MAFFRALMAGAVAVAFALAAHAAQPVKPKAKPQVPRTYAFDGTYHGEMTVTPLLSGPNCRSLPVDNFVINGGVITPADATASLQPVFDGVVTDEGFITGHVRIGDSKVVFEGRAEPMGMVKVISGGVLDDASKCSWVVNLTLE